MNMNEEKTWEEFKSSGLLWFINTILHTFGWAIMCEVDSDKNITRVYPVRTKFRGFPEESNNKGYRNIASYLEENIQSIKSDAYEEFDDEELL